MEKKPLDQLTVEQIVSGENRDINLRTSQLVCTGKKVDRLDRVEGVTVKGVLCDESSYVSFLYLFNDEPFFFAIMEVTPNNQLRPLKGFGAMEKRGIMVPVDLKSRPRLPAWAFGGDGKPLKSIYKEPVAPDSETPAVFR